MNQKKNHGFTLIELLAVIVILAIIALIAVPVIMNIISKANESAFKDTAYGVISAGELYFAERQLEPNGMLEDVTFNLPDTTKTLQLKGEVPTGTITITKEGKISIAVYNNRYCITKGIEDKDVTITEDVANCKLIDPNSLTALATTSTEVTSIPECVTNKTECAQGTPVAIKVNASEVYNFYVMSETGDEITLIMDRNIGNPVMWDDSEGNVFTTVYTRFGPRIALNYLNEQTINWTNIEPVTSYIYNNNLNGTTNEYGYQKLEIKNGVGKLISQDGEIITNIEGSSRARMLTYEEANNIKINNNGIMPVYLYENLSDSSCPYGYWLLTSSASSKGSAKVMYYIDDISYTSNVYDLGAETCNGVRPVITLSK